MVCWSSRIILRLIERMCTSGSSVEVGMHRKGLKEHWEGCHVANERMLQVLSISN